MCACFGGPTLSGMKRNPDELRRIERFYRSRAETAGSDNEREGWIRLADYIERLAKEGIQAPSPRPYHSC